MWGVGLGLEDPAPCIKRAASLGASFSADRRVFLAEQDTSYDPLVFLWVGGGSGGMGLGVAPPICLSLGSHDSQNRQ